MRYPEGGNKMSKVLALYFNIAGCETNCAHCWAMGGHYDCMPYEDVVSIVEQVSDFCSEKEMKFELVPFHDVLAHPDAVKLLPVLDKYIAKDGFSSFTSVFVSTGVALGLREDWKDILTVLKELGGDAFWLAFHGLGDVHDKAVGRKGAFEASVNAVKRLRSMGFKVGGNVFITKENVRQVEQMMNLFKEIDMIEKLWWGIADYSPHTRLRKYEEIRPELKDILEVKDAIASVTGFGVDNYWTNPEEYTEAAYVKKALKNPEEFTKYNVSDKNEFVLVCTHNFDIYLGKGSMYEKFVGNLKRDGVQEVLNRALNIELSSSNLSLYFNTNELPSPQELAQTVGNPEGQKLYFSECPEMYRRWLDLALEKYRKQ